MSGGVLTWSGEGVELWLPVGLSTTMLKDPAVVKSELGIVAEMAVVPVTEILIKLEQFVPRELHHWGIELAAKPVPVMDTAALGRFCVSGVGFVVRLPMLGAPMTVTVTVLEFVFPALSVATAVTL